MHNDTRLQNVIGFSRHFSCSFEISVNFKKGIAVAVSASATPYRLVEQTSVKLLNIAPV